ncbi:hypothetical protein M1L60_44375 [Actinoplanes sp. TRM 88003]|uniref:HTH-type transcriptional repressor Sco4008 C-terminal domain-containing protein n=1 Tax=Paractinoplanes aksuensis TaxID=2939490 RepID=A0ABT1E3C2_9ACTN|nr:hypothetical protein [Actinoplanes aksuensis]MCO8277636.1 hypothetical protein [Actinoplanes aksuensis]
MATASVDAVPFDPLDLPGYAGRLFDSYETGPELVGLAAWYQLERGNDELPPSAVDSLTSKLTQLEQAQHDGHVNPAIPARQLLSLVVHLSLAGTGVTPVLEPRDTDRQAEREAIVEAVRLISAR